METNWTEQKFERKTEDANSEPCKTSNMGKKSSNLAVWQGSECNSELNNWAKTG